MKAQMDVLDLDPKWKKRGGVSEESKLVCNMGVAGGYRGCLHDAFGQFKRSLIVVKFGRGALCLNVKGANYRNLLTYLLTYMGASAPQGKNSKFWGLV